MLASHTPVAYTIECNNISWSASDWCALQEALYKFIDTIQYNTIQWRPNDPTTPISKSWGSRLPNPQVWRLWVVVTKKTGKPDEIESCLAYLEYYMYKCFGESKPIYMYHIESHICKQTTSLLKADQVFWWGKTVYLNYKVVNFLSLETEIFIYTNYQFCLTWNRGSVMNVYRL